MNSLKLHTCINPRRDRNFLGCKYIFICTTCTKPTNIHIPIKGKGVRVPLFRTPPVLTIHLTYILFYNVSYTYSMSDQSKIEILN